MQLNFQYIKTIKALPLTKRYLLYAIAYGLSTLILPFGVQFLVNRLALSGILVNLVIFFLFLFFGLIFTQIVRHTQVILTESLQRSIYAREAPRWSGFLKPEKTHYFFEVHNLLKTFAKSFTHLVELSLIVIFGLTSILMFHPFFIIPAGLIVFTIYILIRTSGPAIKTSIKESDEKYHFYHEIAEGHSFQSDQLVGYLTARDNHFKFIRRYSFYVSLTAYRDWETDRKSVV